MQRVAKLLRNIHTDTSTSSKFTALLARSLHLAISSCVRWLINRSDSPASSSSPCAINTSRLTYVRSLTRVRVDTCRRRLDGRYVSYLLAFCLRKSSSPEEFDISLSRGWRIVGNFSVVFFCFGQFRWWSWRERGKVGRGFLRTWKSIC